MRMLKVTLRKRVMNSLLGQHDFLITGGSLVQILLFSCSFRQSVCLIAGWCIP